MLLVSLSFWPEFSFVSVKLIAVLTWGLLRGLYGIDEFPPNMKGRR